MNNHADITLQPYISRAIRVQAIRCERSLTQVRRQAGYAPTTFGERLKGTKAWNMEDIDRLAKALGMSDGWALYDVARHEAELANGALY